MEEGLEGKGEVGSRIREEGMVDGFLEEESLQ
jgi:hypothetical protein